MQVKKVEDISNTALDSEKHKQELSTVDQLLKHNQKEMKAKNDSLDHLQEQLRDACCVRDTLQSKLTEIYEQLERESADKSFLEWECLAKTQQVKQYKKQVDHQRMQLQESNARIEQYQVQLEQCKHELASCQKDLKKREKNEQKNVSIQNTNRNNNIEFVVSIRNRMNLSAIMNCTELCINWKVEDDGRMGRTLAAVASQL